MNNRADTKVSGEGGRGGAPAARAGIPIENMVHTMDSMAVPPAACGGPWWSRYPSTAHGRTPHWSSGCLKGD